MNRVLRAGAVATAGVALVAGTVLVMGGRADAAKTTVPATFTMYANVDAEGDLGSHAGAVSAVHKYVDYVVTFSKPIGSCAAVAQVGDAGGSDSPDYAEALVFIASPNAFEVEFSRSNEPVSDPFMMTVTCRK